MMPYPNRSALSTPLSPGRNYYNDNALPFNKSTNISDFEIERTPRTSPPGRALARMVPNDFDNEHVLRASVAALLAAKARPYTVSGRIPLDPSSLVLFFRSKSGITHSLDFPIDVEYDTPPALDVLIAACKPHQSLGFDNYPDRESLFYPPNLPLTATLELANHPILDALRNTLFPTLPTGHYLTAVRDKLEVIVDGGRMGPQPLALRNDGRVATVMVALPVRFRGGALIVHDAEGNHEKFYGRGGKSGDMEWTAFLNDCEYEVETVTKGCRISLSYAIFLKTFGPSGIAPDPLISPSDNFLDLVSPVLNMSRGRKIAFYLQHDHGVNPAETLAETLVPSLKGGDSMLYHAIKLFKLTPELHWTAGGYIWPVDRTVECGSESPEGGMGIVANRMPFGAANGQRGVPPVRGAFGTYGGDEGIDVDMLRSRIEDSGAIPLSEADIIVLTGWDSIGGVGKERVPFVSNGELEKLVVNVLLVAYVP
ncbi:hypothetical protein PLICRDRAFT_524272 [Plicaturopsis crispa FD-325 SS-3]|nr:hypothetical protein PLICRDRAFT_524272 [Plicaturopsis crispa FD-325 SS-3]